MINKEDDFIKAYNKVCETIKGYMKSKTVEVCRKVATSPAPRFYISAEEALRHYSKWKKTGKLNFKKKSTEQMYLLIFKRYEAILERDGNLTFSYIAMSEALNSEAPCFYMNPDLAYLFYYKAMKHKRQRMKR